MVIVRLFALSCFSSECFVFGVFCLFWVFVFCMLVVCLLVFVLVSVLRLIGLGVWDLVIVFDLIAFVVD